MRKILFVLFLTAIVPPASQAIASEETAVMAPIHQFIDASTRAI